MINKVLLDNSNFCMNSLVNTQKLDVQSEKSILELRLFNFRVRTWKLAVP